MQRLAADLLLLAAALLWGIAFYFQKDAMADVGPFTFVAARGFIAALALAPLALRERGPAPRLAWHAWISGLAFLTAATLQQTGLVTATVTNAGFLTALYVVFTPLVAWVLLRHRPAGYIWPAVLLSFLGTWALGGGTAGHLSGGDVLVAVSAVFWAIHVVITSRASALGRPFAFTCLQFAVVGALAAPLAFAFETPTPEGLVRASSAIAYVGLISSAVTFSILVIALRHTVPAEAAVLLSTESLFAAAAGAALLGERLSLTSWLGAAAILAAIIIVQIGPRASVTPQPSEASD